MQRTVKQLVDAYYDGWKSGSWKNQLVDIDLFDPAHFQFFGAMDNFNNRKDFAEALISKVGQVLEFGEIYRQFFDGTDVCTIYDFKIGNTVVRAAEWLHTKNGYISEIHLIFDPSKLAP